MAPNPHLPPPPPSAGSRTGTASGQSTGLKDFKQLGALGEGAYSAVYKVLRHSDGKVYALKKVKLPNLSTKEKQNALNEVRLLASVRHKNVIGFYEAFFDERSSSLCIVTEYADGGDLFQKINRHQKMRTHFREDEVWRVLIGMTEGLKALHELRILHRDLKCANVFLNTNGEVKLGDFNVSKVAKRGLCMTQTGTPYYASPEVWRDMPYDAKSDMWSLGCVVYEMVALRPPFRAEDMEALYRKVLHGQYPRIPPVYSRDVSEVIGSLLQVNPRQRPSAEQLLQMPVMRRHMDQLSMRNADVGHVGAGIGPGENDLLNTIKLPKNALELQDCLPRPRYETDVIDEDAPYRDPRAASSGDRAGGMVDSVPHHGQPGPPEPQHLPRGARERRNSGNQPERDRHRSNENDPRQHRDHYQDAQQQYAGSMPPPQKDALDAYMASHGAQNVPLPLNPAGGEPGSSQRGPEGSVVGSSREPGPPPQGGYGPGGGYGGPQGGPPGLDYSQRGPPPLGHYDPRQQQQYGPGPGRGSGSSGVGPAGGPPNAYYAQQMGRGVDPSQQDPRGQPGGRYQESGGGRMKPGGGRQPSYGNPYGPSDGLSAGGYGYHGGPAPSYHGRQSPNQQQGPPPSGGYHQQGPQGMMPPSGGANRPRGSGGGGQLPELSVNRAGGASGHHAHQQYGASGPGQRIGHLPMMNDQRVPRGSYGQHQYQPRGHPGQGHHVQHQYQASGVHQGGHHQGAAYHAGGRRSSGGAGHQGGQVRLPQVHMGVAPANYHRMH